MEYQAYVIGPHEFDHARSETGKSLLWGKVSRDAGNQLVDQLGQLCLDELDEQLFRAREVLVEGCSRYSGRGGYVCVRRSLKSKGSELVECCAQQKLARGISRGHHSEV